jgi:thioredoxin reductase (NADPH)
MAAMADEIAIIGAGPAGLAAAIQLQRFGLQPLVFEKAEMGGLLRNANWVENYPGFPGGISGPRLAQRIERQASRLGVKVIFQEVKRLDFAAGQFRLETDVNHYAATIAIVASGTTARPIRDFAIPAELRSRVFYEVWPIQHLRDQRIAIIGAGDAAFDYALNLAKANYVFLLNRDRQTHCLTLLYERAAACPRISIHANRSVKALNPSVGGIRLEWAEAGSTGSLSVDYLIAAIGRDPETGFFSHTVAEQAGDLQRQGVLVFIGDVHNGMYRQTAIAAGEGLHAAMKIYHTLQEKTA